MGRRWTTSHTTGIDSTVEVLARDEGEAAEAPAKDESRTSGGELMGPFLSTYVDRLNVAANLRRKKVVKGNTRRKYVKKRYSPSTK